MIANQFTEHGVMQPPAMRNEPVKDYAPGSPERAAIRAELQAMSSRRIDMPLIIGGKEVQTDRLEPAIMPHCHSHVLGMAYLAGQEEVLSAIAAANKAWPDWSQRPWTERAAVFLKAAELLSGPWRYKLNAATMLGQSKTVHQAEIDSAAELIDFWRLNVEYMVRIYSEQPSSAPGTWNRVDYRPLEGCVLAITPFNFTAIAGNLPAAPALMGNTVVWKPARTAKFAAHYVMEILREAGLPDGVINLVYGSGAEISRIALADPGFAGLHYTGSTEVFNELYGKIGNGLGRYRTYPRIVGETGGKNFIVAHASAEFESLATAILRGAFEYQGQKCSAASRIFVPRSIWPKLRDRLCDEIASIRVGDVSNLSNFMGAVIDQDSFDRLTQVIAKARTEATVLSGGAADKSEGYFISPTLVAVDDIGSSFLSEEFFGPIASVFVYDDDRFEDVLGKIDTSAKYGLTGSIFSVDRSAITTASNMLRGAAGNFYINDKPTGAVVGQQPFGGARASGTNDKAGSLWNLIRWVSPRTIKETYVPATDYRYPYLSDAVT
jgi:1-pyrroline-5-carboxylate dehydrogenase